MRIRKRREVKSGIKKVGEISFSVGIKVYRGKLEEERQSERDKKGGFGGRLWIALKAVSFFRYTLNFSISSISTCNFLSNFLIFACLVAEKRWGKRKEINLFMKLQIFTFFWSNRTIDYMRLIRLCFFPCFLGNQTQT